MKKQYILLLALPLILAACGSNEAAEIVQEEPGKYVSTEVVKKTNFSEELKLIGKVSPEKETIIASQVAGVIRSIDTEVGKVVKAGTVLAKIDFSSTSIGAAYDNALTAYQNSLNSYGSTKESIEKDLENAKLQLETAKKNKENTYASTEKQLDIAKTQLANIQTQKKNTEATTSNSLELAQKGYDKSKKDLETFEKNSAASIKSLNDKKKGIYDSARVSINSILVSVNGGLTSADQTLWITEKYKPLNDSYEVYLWAKDSSTKTRAESSFSKANALYEKNSKITLSTSDDIDRAFPEILTMMDETVNLYQHMTDMLNNSISSTTFTDTQLEALKTSISNRQNGLLTAQSNLVNLQNGINDINNTIASTETSITGNRSSLETALSIAETNLNNAKSGNTTTLDSVSGNELLIQNQLENTIATVQSTRDTVDSALRMAETQYESLKAKLASQLTGAKGQLDASKGQKDIASIQFENGFIKAPFDGAILQKSVEVGGLINPGTPVFTIGDTNGYVIKADITSENAAYLTLGQEVSIEKDGKNFTGSITVLSPSADPQTKLVKMEVKLSGNPQITETLRFGDFVNIYATKEKTDAMALLVPFSALMAGDQGSFKVFVVGSGSTVTSREVKIGAQNSRFVSITSGLSEGDRVIVSWALTLQEGDKIQENKAKQSAPNSPGAKTTPEKTATGTNNSAIAEKK